MATRRPNKAPPPPYVAPSVTPEQGIQLIKTLIEKAKAAKEKVDLEASDVDVWNNSAKNYLTKIFGSDSPNINAVLSSGRIMAVYPGMSDAEFIQRYREGFESKIKHLEGCIEQLQTDIDLSSPAAAKTSESLRDAPIAGDKVFVVHGRDSGTKETVARFLERLDLEAVILHERANEGRTIIEKFTDFSDVHFAVVLLTGDDEGRLRGTAADLKPRARQNVVLELGYFLGKLGRKKVCVLYQNGVEVPSDYAGVLFVELDPHERWKFDLVRELRAAGFNVDANKAFG